MATADGARALIDAGADAVKVGIGPGSICTTRMVAGVGVPQLTAIMDAAEVCHAQGVPVIADGGIKYSGDLGQGACRRRGLRDDRVACWPARMKAPGEVYLLSGTILQGLSRHGVGRRDGPRGSADRYFQSEVTQPHKLVPEGIEGQIPYKGAGGVRWSAPACRRACAPQWAIQARPRYRRIAQASAKFIRMTSASLAESHVHDVTITREAPNYPGSGKN